MKGRLIRNRRGNPFVRLGSVAGCIDHGVLADRSEAWRLQYKLGGATYQADYAIEGTGYKFVFSDPAGNVRTEAY